ncbi:MAG: 3-deoxy-D-manno-octulosonic acid transferase, partial [Ignavibacteria bacterium]
ITHMTPTGRQTSVELFGDDVERAYLPYDVPGAAQRFLRHFRPQLGMIMETELWPNTIAACCAAGLPLLLLNARLSERSAGRYARWPRLTGEALAGLAAVAAVGSEDADRLRALGAREVEVFGNLKFDIAPPSAQLELGADFRRRRGERRMVLCASTRDGEEELILAAWRAAAPPGVLLAIVPRHPQRFDVVADLVAAKGYRVARRSQDSDIAPETDVWIGDSMGEMFAYYAAADVAFVGGSLLEFGSQNLIEPCSIGTPVLIGPSIFNFRDAAKQAVACGAALAIRNAEELVAAAKALLGDDARRRTMGETGCAFAAAHRGATARNLALVERFIPAAR